jgi:hypothetical protein
MDKLARKWNFQKSEDWLRVTNKMVLKEEGSHFIRTQYDGSVVKGKATLFD